MNKLPVIATVKDSVGYTLSNISLLLRASLVWVLIYVFLVSIFSFLGGDEYLEVFREFGASPTLATSQDPSEAFVELFAKLSAVGEYTGFAYAALLIFGMFAYYGFAISWHRACLLDEQPPLIRAGKLEFKYLFMSFLLIIILYILFVILGIIAGLIMGTIFGALGGANLAGYAAMASLIIVGIGLLLVFSRTNLVFPGIAVQDKRMNLGTSLKLTKGNSWEIFAGNFLCFIPALLAALVYNLIDSIGLPIIISMPIMMVLNFVSVAFALSFMSMCYQFFVPSPDAGDLA